MQINVTALKELLNSIDEKYPNEIPQRHLKAGELERLQGQQDVVRYLKEVIERYG